MFIVEKSAFINRPVDEVFDFASNPANGTQWREDLINEEVTSGGPMGVGATIHVEQTFMGRSAPYDLEITAYERPGKMCFKTTSGPIDVEGCQTYRPHNGGTDMTIVLHCQPGGLLRVAERLIARQIGSRVETELSNLKAVLEG